MTVNTLERKHGQRSLVSISKGYHHLVMEEYSVPNVPGQTCKMKIQSCQQESVLKVTNVFLSQLDSFLLV